MLRSRLQEIIREKVLSKGTNPGFRLDTLAGEKVSATGKVSDVYHAVTLTGQRIDYGETPEELAKKVSLAKVEKDKKARTNILGGAFRVQSTTVNTGEEYADAIRAVAEEMKN